MTDTDVHFWGGTITMVKNKKYLNSSLARFIHTESERAVSAMLVVRHHVQQVKMAINLLQKLLLCPVWVLMVSRLLFYFYEVRTNK